MIEYNALCNKIEGGLSPVFVLFGRTTAGRTWRLLSEVRISEVGIESAKKNSLNEYLFEDVAGSH